MLSQSPSRITGTIRTAKPFCQAFALFGLVTLLTFPSGCGGGSGGGSTPTPTPTPTASPIPRVQTPVVFAVRWGARSRTIAAPSSALSLQLTLHSARPDGSDLNVTLNRNTDPASYTQNVTTSDTANVGTYQANITCYAGNGGTGSVVGVGQATVTIAADGTGIGDVAINGTIASVTIPAGQTIPVGAQTDLGFTCRDASNALVAVSPGSAFFTVTTGTDRLQITNGQGRGLLPGAATVQATVDGIASAPASVQVTSSATVSLIPSDTTLFVEGTQNFTAQVANAPDPSVTWSIQEGAAGGSISTSGVYQAPATPGTYHIIATSVYDPSKQATAAVAVQAVGTRVLYQNEFDGAVGSEWSKTMTGITPFNSRRFLGQFGPEPVTLSLKDLPPHTSLTISFKLFVISTWDGNVVVNLDGNTVGPDVWALSLDNQSLLRTTFGNFEPGSTRDNVLQSYPNAAGQGSFPSRTGASENNSLGFVTPSSGRVQDSVYDLTFTVPHTAKTATFTFSGQENEAIDNESWGIDSVQVTVSGK